MIAGIGTDLLYLHRIEASYERWGQRFLDKVYGPQEQAVFARRYARDKHRGIRYLATRFAVKEAFSKAIGLGIRSPMRWSAVQTLNHESGKPMIVLSEPLKTWYEQKFGSAHVSITDESDLVFAFVLVETR
ncbi:holo-ACP synthase [Basilea psittacipulmonis]|nr:holo-ACP synthase [Basilea psittacipulmonis]